ncbi:NAD-dependent glycerol dehydrogenase [Rhodoferax lithotrophicus]|uniref:NAD-dependent glycerol dehydrogenase n=1 Tax=Rhodoferax lithotrophicus TaxID=2798804 RepID=A0ABN6DBA6_9BURK|nr:oxidoreductase [Rhodoferax sp. MIZ03]BCO29307.1 NAD-dependent glycerol dehydrogenase [Rhodoferax sp. MIZ03]
MQLADKVIVVTGGAGFLGAKFCAAIAEQGGIAVVADVDAATAERVAVQITATCPGRAEAVVLDITSAASINALIRDLQQKHGRIDALVNNAYPRNREYGKKLEEVTYDSFCENVGLHLGGYFLTAQQFSLYFRQHGGGNIINMSSIYGTMTPRFEVYADTPMTMPVEYAAIKSAINQLTRYFAQYFKGDGIRVNSLSPGGILDGQPEPFLRKYNIHCSSKGMLDPQDVCGSLMYLLSDASLYVTGHNLLVDDGFSL